MGEGNQRDVIIDGEHKSGGIFHISNPNVHVCFKNITFINGLTTNFGGMISIETGNVYVDNCIFINGTALDSTNAGAISNYGNTTHKSYLFVNNSLFINNHADHDGGAVTTCYASSDIYNSIFINNSACRDGGAIRVSVEGYGNVEDCIFMYNHADEWGGAYYSWAGTSNINRCIFMNNTAGTNGGAVMVSGNLNLENSIIVNNDGGEVGGSFYIQQPMFNKYTEINVHNNIITNNSSPYGKEIFIKWRNIENLFTDFNNNDWGDENPNDSSINDPDNVTNRIKVTKTIKSNLFSILNFNLLNKYSDLIEQYFPEGYLEEIAANSKKSQNNNENNDFDNVAPNNENNDATVKNNKENLKTDTNSKTNKNTNSNTNNTQNNQQNSKLKSDVKNNNEIVGNSTSYGESKKASELKESSSAVKQSNVDLRICLAGIIIVLLLLSIGYKRNKKEF